MLQSPYLITRVTAQRDRATVIVTDRLYTHLTTFHLPSHLTFLYLSLSSITLHYPIPISLSPFPPHLLFSHPYTFPSYPPSSPLHTPHALPSISRSRTLQFPFPSRIHSHALTRPVHPLLCYTPSFPYYTSLTPLYITCTVLYTHSLNLFYKFTFCKILFM